MTLKVMIALVFIFCDLLQANQYVTADFGLPTSVVGGTMISSNANSINSVLNSLNQNLRRYSPDKQSGHLRSASEKIAQMGQKIADLGKLITGNVSKAANDRSTPVGEVFKSLQNSYEQMSLYLRADAIVSIDSLNENLGNPLTEQLEKALDGVSQAIVNVTSATEMFEEAVNRTMHAANGKPVTRGTINANIPPNLTISMSKALVQVKEQTALLSKVIENVLKNIAFVDSYLVKVNATALSMEQRVNSTMLNVVQMYPAEADTIIKRYYNSHDTFQIELSNAISRLSTFRADPELQKLVDGFMEAYTKIYYNMYSRNQTDVESILKTYNETVSTINSTIESLNANITTSMQQTAASVSFQYLSQNPNFEFCFNKYQSQVLSAFSNTNNGIINCLGRERNRLGRLPDVVDRTLRLSDATTEDFANNIQSCAAHNGFANSPTTYQLAVACLKTTLNHSESFQQLMDQGYDDLLQQLNREGARSRFRIGDCLETRRTESVALIDILYEEIDQCLNSGTSNRQFDLADEQVIELIATEEVDDVPTTTDYGTNLNDYPSEEKSMVLFGNY